jgi:hypothetical protein
MAQTWNSSSGDFGASTTFIPLSYSILSSSTKGCKYTSMFFTRDFPSTIKAREMNVFLVVIHGGMLWLTMHVGHNE